MNDIAKILGWTIGGAVLVALASKATTSTVISSLTNGWAKIISSITGGGTQQQPPQGGTAG